MDINNGIKNISWGLTLDEIKKLYPTTTDGFINGRNPMTGKTMSIPSGKQIPDFELDEGVKVNLQVYFDGSGKLFKITFRPAGALTEETMLVQRKIVEILSNDKVTPEPGFEYSETYKYSDSIDIEAIEDENGFSFTIQKKL